MKHLKLMSACYLTVRKSGWESSAGTDTLLRQKTSIKTVSNIQNKYVSYFDMSVNTTGYSYIHYLW